MAPADAACPCLALLAEADRPLVARHLRELVERVARERPMPWDLDDYWDDRQNYDRALQEILDRIYPFTPDEPF